MPKTDRVRMGARLHCQSPAVDQMSDAHQPPEWRNATYGRRPRAAIRLHRITTIAACVPAAAQARLAAPETTRLNRAHTPAHAPAVRASVIATSTIITVVSPDARSQLGPCPAAPQSAAALRLHRVVGLFEQQTVYLHFSDNQRAIMNPLVLTTFEG